MYCQPKVLVLNLYVLPICTYKIHSTCISDIPLFYIFIYFFNVYVVKGLIIIIRMKYFYELKGNSDD